MFSSDPAIRRQAKFLKWENPNLAHLSDEEAIANVRGQQAAYEAAKANKPHGIKKIAREVKRVGKQAEHVVSNVGHAAEKHIGRPLVKHGLPIAAAVVLNHFVPGAGTAAYAAYSAHRNRRRGSEGDIPGMQPEEGFESGSGYGGSGAPPIGGLGQFAPQAEGESQAGLQSMLPKLSPFELFGTLYPRQKEEEEEEEKKHSLAKFKPKSIKEYAGGGHIRHSDTGGQDDDVPMKIPNGSYVWNATDVSLLGDGNTDNGVKKLRDFEQNFAKSGVYNSPEHYKGMINAKVSNGEYVMSPHAVSAIGKGDNAKGAKIIDKARMSLRKQKGVAKILPPKSKDIKSYMKGGK